MTRTITLIALCLCLAGCDGPASCDYVVQWDAAYKHFYIYSCGAVRNSLEIGYGRFDTFEEAANKVREIRRNGADPKARTHFIEVPQ